LQEVFEQGITQKTHDIVLAMHAKGFDLTVIDDITGLTVAQVQTLLQAQAGFLGLVREFVAVDPLLSFYFTLAQKYKTQQRYLQRVQCFVR
jgi:hypothetical protein